MALKRQSWTESLVPTHRGTRCRRTVALCLPAALLLAVPIGRAAEVSGFMQVTVSPGDTAQCDSNPCQVMFNIPAGSGGVVVTGNEVTWGTYPAGQTANLGQVFNSTAFAIEGMDVPKVWVYVPSDP
ncbi:hypothetical protein [Thiocapsa rosea]|uniref:Uncharacterized protein n=1 Tax=Thiocapsa rosea TaxID=69360 RepID=A0A495V7R4_9GAMM|nr:hypothetical protein [Thiocapsa rosea]RKT45451.1 hypothetical protein BDD21_2907 [Thiocapsa rosea]